MSPHSSRESSSHEPAPRLSVSHLSGHRLSTAHAVTSPTARVRKPGHAGAQDDHPGCLGGTRSRHHHGEEALIQVGGDQHGLVSGNIGLR